MIFVTVGTHEQQFDRLVKEVDELKKSGIIQEEVVVQSGFSEYKPCCCTGERFYPYQKIMELIAQAHIVITHGAPATFIPVLQQGKVPIVVPRQKAFREHVNDHQMAFCKAVSQRQGNVIVVEDISRLAETIRNYDATVEKMSVTATVSNNAVFNRRLEEMVEELLHE